VRTLYLRIAATFALAFVFSFIAMLVVTAELLGRSTKEYFEGSLKLQLQEARGAYEKGGPSELKSYLDMVDSALKGTRSLTDADGRDLVSGADRSAVRFPQFNFLGLPKSVNGQVTIAKRSADGRFYLIVSAPPPIALSQFTPYFVIIIGLTGVLAWGLSAGIVVPLLKVAGTVEQFGKGDLSARIQMTRQDEIGDVARAFNSMAQRIETLLTAERRLLQDVSHELRSPLARLSFAVELTRTAPDRVVAANRVRREVERLNRLISTLVEMTSAEGDPASRKTERLDLVALAREIIEDCAIEAEARSVAIQVDAPFSLHIVGDPELLRRAIENVLRNAIRFTPNDSQVSVVISETRDLSVIRVGDQGPGVPDEFLLRIFDPFFRVDESRERTGDSVGLGLSIARRAVLLHHGSVVAENAHPGLRVTISIPRVQ